MLPELPHIRRGGVVLLPVRAMERWLDAEATKERRREEQLVDELVQAVKDDYD